MKMILRSTSSAKKMLTIFSAEICGYIVAREISTTKVGVGNVYIVQQWLKVDMIEE